MPDVPGVYRVVMRFRGNEIDCLVALRAEAGEPWLACADVIVDGGSPLTVLAAALAYGLEISASLAATSSARGSAVDS
ncbi:hypothetical protein [Amycolatopsis alkalitolerans]|uniref:Uncharacterized protein n=1 Tax=Amycolatopsis alkalitolerans TaxID=2547244 RepID=A0A5C4LSW7_9PSEU|nr:hypothetical protein [Amycolatopsis alkalitolerans]TNC22116.1 hypothetical protein FG385_26575 [Amycolatopsis alkalitolerans]